MPASEIIGVTLAKNEDRFLGRALENASAFCDRFLLFDHGSKDGTAGIMKAFTGGRPNAEYRSVGHPRESHEALLQFCGKPAWIFGVDGDEVYDPAGLARMRGRILAGEFDSGWMVMGHCLHCDGVEAGRASGYMAPPSRSITKLYNFAAIDAWPGDCKERLHGGAPVFRPGFSSSSKRLLFEESGWEDSPFRCLHLCFCQRSSLQAHGGSARPNIDELYNGRLPFFLQSLVARCFPGGSKWKRERYMRGEKAALDAKPFFSDP